MFRAVFLRQKTTEPDNNQNVVANETTVLTTQEQNSINTVNANQIVMTGVSASDYQQGDILVSKPFNEAPNGLLRKVQSITTQGNQVLINTSPAPLEDAFDQLDLNIS